MLRSIAEQNGPVNADSLQIPPLPYLSTRATNTRCVHYNHLSISPVKQPTTTAVASSPHEEQEERHLAMLVSAFDESAVKDLNNVSGDAWDVYMRVLRRVFHPGKFCEIVFSCDDLVYSMQ